MFSVNLSTRPGDGHVVVEVSIYRVTGDVAGMPAQAVLPADQTDRGRR
jgi:hypothetical protein